MMTRIDALSTAWPCGVATFRLRGIKDAVELGTTCRQYWFRGHPQTFDSLLPTIHREPFCSVRTNIEFRAAERFRFRARSFTSKVPEWNDHLSWLLLMQHHGVPTRLLDWTESILVALFFAAEEPERDGELWCMNPSQLNVSSGCHICMPDDPRIAYLTAEVFLDPKGLPKLASALEFQEVPTRTLALVPPFEFPRMAAQLSRFTIHPSLDGSSMIEFLLRSEEHLVRYIIPAERKAALKKDLASLGVTREALFHSLESLATTIRDEIFEEDYELVSPPHFDGETG